MVAFNTALNYRPNDWYWFIGGDTSNVWSSARAMLVPATDADYVAWLDAGRQPANAATMSDVEATLAIAYPRGTPRTYAADARYRKAGGGVVISSLSAVPFLTDPVSRNTVNSAYDYALANAGVVVQWKLADGVTFIPLDKNKITLVMTSRASCSLVLLARASCPPASLTAASPRWRRSTLYSRRSQTSFRKGKRHGDRQHHDAERRRLLPAVRAADDRRHPDRYDRRVARNNAAAACGG